MGPWSGARRHRHMPAPERAPWRGAAMIHHAPWSSSNKTFITWHVISLAESQKTQHGSQRHSWARRPQRVPRSVQLILLSKDASSREDGGRAAI